MSFLGDLFGDSEQESTTSVSIPSWLKPEVEYGVQEARRLYDQGAPDFYPFDTVAELTPDIQSALAQYSGFGAGEGGRLQSALSRTYGNAGDIISSYYGSDQAAPQITTDAIADFYNSDLVEQQRKPLEDQTYSALDRYLGTNLAEGAAMTGGVGGGREAVLQGTAIGDAIRNLQSGLTDINTQAYNQAANLAGQNVGFQQSANALEASNIANLMQGQLAGTQSAYDLGQRNIGSQLLAGEYGREYDQALINEQMQRYMYPYESQQNALMNYMNVINPTLGMTTGQTTTTSGGGGLLSNLMPLGTLAMGAGSLLSGGAKAGLWGAGA